VADFENLEAFDGFAPLRNQIRHISNKIGEWAGMPMPLADQRLVVEPTYPKATELSQLGQPVDEEPLPEGMRIRNIFWSSRWRAEIIIWEEDGKICWAPGTVANQLGKLLQTLGASDAWGIEQESVAVRLLGTLVSHRKFKQYMLTGSFLERSPRSGVMYMFRRLRPTVAITMTGPTPRILCALCMHPIAYYADSWAGAMCPTDDVIAALSMMRGDEHMFWRRANQHPACRMEAGIS
jgi:hypothetical protein